MGNMITDPAVAEPFPIDPSEPLIFSPGQLAITLQANGFPRSQWAPDLVALAVLAEFAALDWRTRIALEPPPAPDSAATTAELDELVRLAGELRAARAAEIAAQDDGFPAWWVQLLAIQRRPGSPLYELLKIAMRVGELTMVHFKLRFNRPRPQQLRPALMPLLPMPGHPSYPSGHMTIARLMSKVAAGVVPALDGPLQALALRVGHNREIAGLHYPSDTAAGLSLADQAFALLETCPGYRTAVEAARAEWNARLA